MNRVEPTGSLLPERPRGTALEHSIDIEAPADAVWEVLADVGEWGSWNPVYPEAKGSATEGGIIELTIALPGMKAQKSKAVVRHSIPGHALQFGASALAGLASATRYIEIHPNGARGCTVVNGEAFARLLGPILVRIVGSRITDGLRRQSEGLKAAAEKKHKRSKQ